MLESVKSQMDNLDLIVADFIEAEGGLNYSKEKIVELNKTEKLKLELNYILVAICKNGGLIALCKTRNYKDISNSSINDNIIIMHQDASSRYLIPIDWNYEGRYIVHPKPHRTKAERLPCWWHNRGSAIRRYLPAESPARRKRLYPAVQAV